MTDWRRTAWPALDRGRVLRDDGAIVAIDKPPGVPSQESSPGDGDDLPSRAKEALGLDYVGVHQRLDAETSGVIVYARDEAANPGLARAFEGRAVEKRYLAGVVGWPKGHAATITERLAHRGGTTVVDPRGEPAITHVRERARRGERALVEVRIETGRTHQIRAHLAHARAPIAGDARYGGMRADRLMLHASSLALPHPIDGSSLSIEAPMPIELDEWLAGHTITPILESPDRLRRALDRARERRFALARAGLRTERATDAFRLVHGAGDAIDGVAVDVYGEWLVAHLYGELAEARRDAILDALEPLGARGIYVKARPRQANELGEAGLRALAGERPERGEPAPDELLVRENGTPFLVRLGDGMSTGLFLDQRDNRARIRELSRGARVLNLFAYTCAFSVVAAEGGAAMTVSVDASQRALDRGRANLALTRAASADHRFIKDDAFDVLARLGRRGERFEVIVCDPPTYSNAKAKRGGAKRWTSGASWRGLAASCLSVLAPGGTLLATSNDQRMLPGALRGYVRDAARELGLEVRAVDLPLPRDFPVGIAESPHMQGVRVTRL